MNRLTFTLFLSLSWTFTFANAVDSIDLETYLRENNIHPKTLEDGLYYQIDEKGHGNLPNAGDYLVVNYVGKLTNGAVFDESGTEPFVFQLGYRQVIRGWEKGLANFQIGSKGTLFVPPHLGYGKTGAGKAIPPNAALIYEIEVLKIMDYAAYDRYMVDLENKERIAFENEQKTHFSNDKKLIHEFASSKKMRTKRLSSGVSYSLKKKGKGETPKDGDVISFHYEGTLLDGSEFDSSYKRNEAFEFEFGKGRAIKGLEEGLRYFKKGAEGWVLIPSKLAYGPMEIDEEGTFIPANSVLVFKVKVLKIERKNK